MTAPIHSFHQKIASFCELRLACALPKHDYDNLRHYMLDFVVRRAMPPQTGNKLDWKEIGLACDLDEDSLRITKRLAKHGFEAIIRWLKGPSASTPARKAECSCWISYDATLAAVWCPWVMANCVRG